ncbi:helix-turn-helix domain-containing protein [Mammaliicoccus sciuri]|uniref:helix-turn-helix domain-containing protein n=1 Tax=Mammaliicoccus sciuri TaxID=1296 RepID=UPI00194EB005|nr:helix-turn-helix transcriptional regulator [Mammaliicoccus sciuri]MEB7846333.1 helix-turn-helix domain-containing protein [Mammaliicoccus sciuri]
MDYEQILKTIGLSLKATRQNKLLSQQEVANRTNIPRVYISKIENGQHIEVKFKVIIQLCAFYEMKLSDIIKEF